MQRIAFLLCFALWCSVVTPTDVADSGVILQCDDSSWYGTGQTLQHVSSEVPLTWKEMDEECARTHRHYRLLQTRHLRLSLRDRAERCGDEVLVPLGVRKINGTLSWLDEPDWKTVGDATLRRMAAGDDFRDDISGVGVLNLTSGEWSLSRHRTFFQCALCQSNQLDDTEIHTKINLSVFNSSLATAEMAKSNLKEAIKSLMVSIKATKEKSLVSFVTDNAVLMESICDLYKVAYNSKVDILDEVMRLTADVAKVPILRDLLEDVASVASSLVQLNVDDLFELEMKVYGSSRLDVLTMDELLKILRSRCNENNDILWLFKQRTWNAIDSLKKVLLKVILPPGTNSVVVEKQYSTLIVVDQSQFRRNPVVGFSMTKDLDQFSFHLTRLNNINADLSQRSIYNVIFPASLIYIEARMAFLVNVFKNEVFPKKTLRNNTGTHLIPVINFVVSSVDTLNTLSDDNIIAFTFSSEPYKSKNSLSQYMKRECSYWDSGQDNWSTCGCSYFNYPEEMSVTMCRCKNSSLEKCNTITTGQIIVEDWIDYENYLKSNQHNSNSHVLGYISLVGYSLSLFGFLGIIITDMFFKTWRQERSRTIHLHLSLAVTLNAFFIILVTFLKKDLERSYCMAVGVFLHYSQLACFSWLLVLSSWQLVPLLSDNRVKQWFLRYTPAILLGWILPLIPVVTLLSWDPHAYWPLSEVSHHEVGGPSYITAVRAHHISIVNLLDPQKLHLEAVNRKVCYPSGFALHESERAPVAFMLLLNVVVFVLTGWRIMFHWLAAKNSKNMETNLSGAVGRLILSFVLVCFISLPYWFGYLAIQTIPSYILAAVISLRGFVLFVVFVLFESRIMPPPEHGISNKHYTAIT